MHLLYGLAFANALGPILAGFDDGDLIKGGPDHLANYRLTVTVNPRPGPRCLQQLQVSFSEPPSESRQLRLPEPRSLCKVERVVEHYISGFSSSNSGTISSRLVLCILDFKLLGHLVSSGFLEMVILLIVAQSHQW